MKRRLRSLALVATLAVGGVLSVAPGARGAISRPVAAGTTVQPARDLAVIARVEQATESVRGLSARHAVPVSMLTPAAFKALVARNFDRDVTAADIRDEFQPLALFGILSPRADLRSLLRAEEINNILAFYDPRVKRFYIPVHAGGLSLVDQVTISHEYTHALQDQAFNLNRVLPDTEHLTVHNSDRVLARTALVEGDATIEMILFARTAFSPAQYSQFLREYARQGQNSAGHTPRFLLDQLGFPYDRGAAFDAALLTPTMFGPSFTRVNAAFRHLPVSTRQILHESLYAQDPNAVTPDLPSPSPALAPGWRRVDSDVVGQYELQDVLAQRLDTRSAAAAADAWRADRYGLFDKGRDYLLAWRLRADTVPGARAMARGLAAYMSRRYHAALALRGGSFTHSGVDSALALRVAGRDVFVVLASRGTLLGMARTALASLH